MTITKPKPTSVPKLGTLISRIKADVQNFVSALAGVARDTPRLAPLVAAAFKQFQDETPDGTKLEFIKMFATREQMKDWPENDLQAKAPGGPVQALFNGIEYLLRKASQLQRQAETDAKLEQAVKEATEVARDEVKRQGLKGEEAKEFIERAQQEAVDSTSVAARARVSQDDVVEIIWDGWYSDLDDFEVFKKFVGNLIALKYSERTVSAILQKAQSRIEKAQEELEAHGRKMEEEEPEVPATPTLPFRKRAAA